MKFKGIVKRYSGRGRQLGFPTANIQAPKDLSDGLYVGLANDKPSLIFIGANQTFGETDRRAEIYILDFNDDLYDKLIEIETLKKLRDVIKFETKEELITQMKKDEEDARLYFN
jgi:riboflavin kinase/FMN adenylyltransferase